MIELFGKALVVQGDARRLPLADKSVHCVVTSPPYFGLRDYGDDGREIGCEANPDCLGWATGLPCGECFVCVMVAVFREVRRVLRDDGTAWINLGDSFCTIPHGPRGANALDKKYPSGRTRTGERPNRKPLAGYKHKDMRMTPHRTAIALQADGWYVRTDIIWEKPNGMPESVRDRPTRNHEYVFLLAKSARYYYDQDACRSPQKTLGKRHEGKSGYRPEHPPKGGIKQRELHPLGSAIGTVWKINIAPSGVNHFAMFPPALPDRCIRLGTSERGVCPGCAAPWVRVVHRERVPTRPGRETKIEGRTQEEYGNRDPLRHVTRTKLLGWRPSCRCYGDLPAGEPAPDSWAAARPIVFDPFGGAGTTACAAVQAGRDAVVTELFAANTEIALRRVQRAPFEAIESRGTKPKSAPTHRSLFD